MNAQFAILGFLNQTPNYGYDLKKLYDKFFGQDKPILTGQIYSTLSRLRRDEKVREVSTAENSGGPERIKYEITEQGKRALQDWLSAPEIPSPGFRTKLYLKTIVAVMENGDAAPFLATQRQSHIARMRELTRQRRSSNLAEILMIDNAIFHLEADLRWIDLASSRLTKLKEEINVKTNN